MIPINLCGYFLVCFGFLESTIFREFNYFRSAYFEPAVKGVHFLKREDVRK